MYVEVGRMGKNGKKTLVKGTVASNLPGPWPLWIGLGINTNLIMVFIFVETASILYCTVITIFNLANAKRKQIKKF
jgi:hypothetical protein